MPRLARYRARIYQLLLDRYGYSERSVSIKDFKEGGIYWVQVFYYTELVYNTWGGTQGDAYRQVIAGLEKA